MAEAAMTVTYEGPALDAHRMDVRDLAPALLAYADLLQEANEVIEPGAPPVTLNIRASGEGSFLVQLIVVQPDLPHRIIDIFAGDSADALSNLLAIAGPPVGGLLWFIKRLRGRRITRAVQTEPGEVRLTLEDGESLTIPAKTLDLHRRVSIRRKVERFLEPLDREGIDAVRLSSEETIDVQAGEKAFFEVEPSAPQALGDEEATMILSIASVAFTEGNKWRLSDGDRTFYAAIEDEAFLARVDSGAEAFRKGDYLKCKLRIEQFRDEAGLHTEWRVVEVREHIPADRIEEIELFPNESDEPPGAGIT